MSFEIIIKERRWITTTAGKDWVVIGTREVERDDRFCRADNEPKTRIEEIRGYSPEIEKKVIQEREILKQTVDNLDLNAVIKAINGL